MEYDKVVENLEDDYVLLKKGKWWSFVGGAFAFLVVAGLVSYQAGLQAIKDSAADTATRNIISLEEDSRNKVTAIENTSNRVKDILASLRDPAHLAGWTMVFQNDADGAHLAGHLNMLLEAIQLGADVKISYRDDAKSRKVFASCEWVFIDDSDQQNSVACQNSSHISVQETIGDKFGFQDKVYHWYLMVNTGGSVHMSRWYVENGERHTSGDTRTSFGVKWYVKML